MEYTLATCPIFWDHLTTVEIDENKTPCSYLKPHEEKVIQQFRGITFSLLNFDEETNIPNLEFHIQVSNDKVGIFCPGLESTCEFWVDPGDRLENISVPYLIIGEYMGYDDEFAREKPLVSFSILKRKTQAKGGL